MRTTEQIERSNVGSEQSQTDPLHERSSVAARQVVELRSDPREPPPITRRLTNLFSRNPVARRSTPPRSKADGFEYSLHRDTITAWQQHKASAIFDRCPLSAPRALPAKVRKFIDIVAKNFSQIDWDSSARDVGRLGNPISQAIVSNTRPGRAEKSARPR